MLAGVAIDAAFADPRRGHPVALFGTAAAALEKRVYGDARARGALYVGLCVGPVALLGIRRDPAGKPGGARRAERRRHLGGPRRHDARPRGPPMAGTLEDGDLEGARGRLSHLCGRDPSRLDAPELARATIESIAENTSDAVVAPLFWGAVAGVPGLLAYRAVNTLDAMVGHRSARYERFGWASARLDDVANFVPARLTGLLTSARRALAGGSPRRAAAILRRDGHRHPSPNAGRCEAAFAGALGVRSAASTTTAAAWNSDPSSAMAPAPPSRTFAGPYGWRARCPWPRAGVLARSEATPEGWRSVSDRGWPGGRYGRRRVMLVTMMVDSPRELPAVLDGPGAAGPVVAVTKCSGSRNDRQC